MVAISTVRLFGTNLRVLLLMVSKAKRDGNSTVSDSSASGRIDMLTSPVATARAAVATGAWVTSKHDVSDTWKCGSLSFIFTRPPEDFIKVEKRQL